MNIEYCFYRRVAFHETDSMGVVHHANYIKFFEEARVAWLRDQGLVKMHVPLGPYSFAVIDVNCQYLRPARFEDEVRVFVRAKLDGARIVFQYAVVGPAGEMMARGESVLVTLREDLRPTRLPQEMRAAFAQLPAGDRWEKNWTPGAAG